MNRLIGDLLDITRLEAGRLVLEQEPVSVTDLLSQTRESWKALAAGRELSLEVGPAPEGLAVLADRSRVLQVLDNLVGNAVKFSEAGGRIAVRATRSEASPTEVRFTVSDTGPRDSTRRVEGALPAFLAGERGRSSRTRTRTRHLQGHRRGSRRPHLVRESGGPRSTIHLHAAHLASNGRRPVCRCHARPDRFFPVHRYRSTGPPGPPVHRSTRSAPTVPFTYLSNHARSLSIL